MDVSETASSPLWQNPEFWTAFISALALIAAGIAIWQSQVAKRDARTLGVPAVRITSIELSPNGSRVTVRNGGPNVATAVMVHFAIETLDSARPFIKNEEHLSDKTPLPLLEPGREHVFMGDPSASAVLAPEMGQGQVFVTWTDPYKTAHRSYEHPTPAAVEW